MRNYLFYFILFFNISTYSQDFRIDATVVDSWTGERLDSVTMDLLNPDSTVAYSFKSKKYGKWDFNVYIDKPSTYILRFSRKNYDDTYMSKTFNYVKYRKTFEDIGNVLMKKRYARNVSLNEITVRPTQIKMFVKGDTIVYNADAFNLPDGSMLDRLIQMLPGANIDDNGQIFVNGRKISSLSLNGNDFFNGNPKIALDNLPAYIVKNIKVYERQSDKDIALGLQKSGKEHPLVMDVNLKKQYSIGWMGNAEGGLGTDGHYAGRAFLMRFSKQSRVALYIDANDINEEYTYRSDGKWSDNQSDDGLLRTIKGGLDIVVNDKHKHFKLDGSATGSIIKDSREEYSSITEFYSNGNIFRKQKENIEDKKVSLNSSLNYSWSPWQGMYFKISPFLKYQYHKNVSGLLSADFTTAVKEQYRGEMLDSVFSPVGLSSIYRALTLSTLENNILGKGHDMTTGVSSELSLKPSGTSDIITILGSFRYRNSKNERINDYRHLAKGQTVNNYYNYRTSPIDNYAYSIKGGYTYFLEDFISKDSRTAVDVSYTYAQDYVSDSRQFYNLSDTDFDGKSIDDLSSVTDRMSMFMDAVNSYNSSMLSKTHRGELTIDGLIYSGGKDISYSLGVPFVIKDERLSYKQAILDTVAKRNKFYFEPYFKFKYRQKIERVIKGVEMKYQLSQGLPGMLHTLDYRDESTPLIIRIGNQNLKMSNHHSTYLRLFKEDRERLEFISLSLYHNLMLNMLCQSMSYDSDSGTRTYRPQNINGNWNAGMVLVYEFPSATNKRKLTTKTEVKYSNNVDFASTGNNNSNRNSVRNTNVVERISFMFYKGNYLPIFNIDLNVMYTHSESRLFDTMNLFDINCGLRGRIPLPWNMEMEHKLDTYVHRGYQDDNFNTEKFIWSAYIQKQFMKGDLTIRLEAFDILNKMSNIQHVLTSQMQKETFHNSIRQYFMLKIKYNFRKQPQKR